MPNWNLLLIISANANRAYMLIANKHSNSQIEKVVIEIKFIVVAKIYVIILLLY